MRGAPTPHKGHTSRGWPEGNPRAAESGRSHGPVSGASESMETGRRESGGCGCLRNGEVRQRTGMDALLPGIPVDAISS